MDQDNNQQPRKQAPPESGDAGQPAPDKVKQAVRFMLLALLLAVSVRVFLYEPFSISSESMLPTLRVGDQVLVAKYPYGYSRHSLPFSPPFFSGRIFGGEVTRGDVAVFKLPRDRRTNYIKRVVGLPGDRIQMIDGVLHINGVAVERARIEDYVEPIREGGRCQSLRFEEQTKQGAQCRYPRYRERLPNGVTYETLDLEVDNALDNTREFQVPEGHYFVLGNSRDNSEDSRRPASVGVGYVPREYLVGRADIVLFSLNRRARLWQLWRWPSALRTDRTLKAVE